MSALDSPLEALAFDYLSFGLLTAVNNVWTWVAVLTAAVSVWKFRAWSSPRGRYTAVSSSSSSSSSPVERVPTEASTSTQVEETDARPSTAAAAAPSSSPLCLLISEGRTSGKFTFYYDREEEEDNGDVDGDDGNVEGEKEYLLIDGWEVMMRMRLGDQMGFYRYQDLTVLDGSVVRLWESRRRRSCGTVVTPLIRCGRGEDCIMW
ncbi:hypothetical protein ACH5RR_006256 [Cinchona calisaya]|uniref:Uncharacterized protein n=1 Tax=Cinchona calisaya TaxID=153742 RepID=A0ABD3ANJ1_9GENT